MARLPASLVLLVTISISIGLTNLLVIAQNPAQTNESPQSSSRLYDLFVSPFRSLSKFASSVLSSGVEDVQDRFDSLQQQSFKIFMRLYNKTYPAAEIPKRMRLFLARQGLIKESEREYAAGKLPFVMRQNPYIDWDEEELSKLTGVAPPKSLKNLSPDERDLLLGREQEATELNSTSLDEDIGIRTRADGDQTGASASVDWRKSGCVAQPLDQQKCGCCYAIATMNVVESMRCIRKVSSPTLSPQQIIDCSTKRAGYENFGCDGGWPTQVLKYLRNVGAASREVCYPLVLSQRACKLNQARQTKGCTVAPSPSSGTFNYKILKNERDIMYHVKNTGPVITVMKATDRFLYYGSGIFDDSTCSRRADDVDHAISIVGYGQENGQSYWLIKNSWGADWGLDGFGKFRRGKNACSIGHWGWVVL